MTSSSHILSLLDLTSLNETDTPSIIEGLCRRAVNPLGSVAAVCFFPRFVSQAKELLKGTSVKVATVVNFPSGESAAEAVAQEITIALRDDADEIDIVMPYGAFLAGDLKRSRSVLEAGRKASGNKTLKVILESGVFTDLSLLKKAAELAIDCGADFLKTSTGKKPVGATLEAAEVMLQVCKNSSRPVGFKASGGIRDVPTAKSYLDLAARIIGPDWANPETFRFGASSLLDNLLNFPSPPNVHHKETY